jgi:hypothetical protein
MRTKIEMTTMNDLILFYKGKVVALLTEAEIVNNTSDSLIQTGYLMERIADAMREFGVFEDLYHPKQDEQRK